MTLEVGAEVGAFWGWLGCAALSENGFQILSFAAPELPPRSAGERNGDSATVRKVVRTTHARLLDDLAPRRQPSSPVGYYCQTAVGT